MIDKNRALEPIEFIQLLHLADDFYGKPFILQDWQHEVIWNVYGEVNDRGLRQYRFAYLEIPKKNGKTTLIAGLGLYHLVCDGPGGQIYCCAAEREQAALTYRAAVQMIDQDPELAALLRIVESKKEIHNRETGTVMKVLSAEAYSKHGLNPTVVIFDELHAQPNRELWEVMTFGAGAARREPLWWVITTAGDDPDRNSIGWEQHEYARKVRDGELIDPTWFVRIYCAPEDADIFDEAIWYQANPSLGVSIDIETVRQEALSARNSEAAERLFRWLRLNQWIAIKRVGWLPLTLWDSTVGNWSPAELVGKRCYIGLDLASTTDIAAVVLLFPPQKEIADWRALFKAFIPLAGIKERIRKDKVPYDQWEKEGFLVATEGDAIDYEVIQLHIESVARIYNLEYICVDRWQSHMLVQSLAKKEMKIIEIPQTVEGMSPAMKEIERLIRINKITHEHHPVARWCFGNVVTHADGNGNIKPMRNRSFEKIDLIVGLIIAMAAAMKLEKQASVYDQRGMRSLG